MRHTDLVQCYLVLFLFCFEKAMILFIPCIRSASPIIVTLVTFWHFTVVRKEQLTPSIAFTTVSAIFIAVCTLC